MRDGTEKGASTMHYPPWPAIARRPAFRCLTHIFVWLRAMVVLAVVAIATVGSSARVSGEMNAALQTPGAHTIAILLLAAPLALAFRRSSLARKQ